MFMIEVRYKLIFLVKLNENDSLCLYCRLSFYVLVCNDNTFLFFLNMGVHCPQPVTCATIADAYTNHEK